MRQDTHKFGLRLTKTGLPSFWEKKPTGNRCQLVAGIDGAPLCPTYVSKTNGKDSDEKHALFIVAVGFILVTAHKSETGIAINFWQVTEIVPGVEDDGKIIATRINLWSFTKGWADKPSEAQGLLARAAMDKLTCARCVHVHYALKNPSRNDANHLGLPTIPIA